MSANTYYYYSTGLILNLMKKYLIKIHFLTTLKISSSSYFLFSLSYCDRWVLLYVRIHSIYYTHMFRHTCQNLKHGYMEVE